MTQVIRVSDEVKSRLEELKGTLTWEELMNDVIARLEELQRINDFKTLYSEYGNHEIEHLDYKTGRQKPGLIKARVARMIEVIKKWNRTHPIEKQIAPSTSLLMDVRNELKRTNPSITTIVRGNYTEFNDEIKAYCEAMGFDSNHNRRCGGFKSALECFSYLK